MATKPVETRKHDVYARVEFYVTMHGEGDARKREFRWRLKTANGQIVCASSEGFYSRDGARRNFNRCRELLADPNLRIEHASK